MATDRETPSRFEDVPNLTAPISVSHPAPITGGSAGGVSYTTGSTATTPAPVPDPPKQPEELAPTPGGASVVAVPANTTNVTAQSTQPIVIALLRGTALATVVAAVELFRSVQLDYSWIDAAVSAALLFFVTVQGRGVIEGAFDTFRATKV